MAWRRPRRTVIQLTGDPSESGSGGGVLYRDEYGVTWHTWEYVEDREDEDPWLQWYISIPDDVIAWYNWVDWLQVARHEGWPPPIPRPSDPSGTREIVELGRSKDPVQRWRLVDAIASYYGNENLADPSDYVSWRDIKRQWPRILR